MVCRYQDRDACRGRRYCRQYQSGKVATLGAVELVVEADGIVAFKILGSRSVMLSHIVDTGGTFSEFESEEENLTDVIKDERLRTHCGDVK